MQVNLSICHQSKIKSALEMVRQTDLSYCQYYPIPVFWRLSSPARDSVRLPSSGTLQRSGECSTLPMACLNHSVGQGFGDRIIV